MDKALCSVIIDELDVDKLLRYLYNGRRPDRIHTLICSCGAIADLRTSPKAWNGWQELPYAKCPGCLLQPPALFNEMQLQPAHQRFLETLSRL